MLRGMICNRLFFLGARHFILSRDSTTPVTHEQKIPPSEKFEFQKAVSCFVLFPVI